MGASEAAARVEPQEAAGVDAAEDVGSRRFCDAVVGFECHELPESETVLLVARRDPDEPHPLMLWDQGGPGAAPVGSTEVLLAAAPKWAADLDVALLVEPWLVNSDRAASCAPAPTSPECLAELAVTPHRVRMAADEMRRATGRTIAGVYAESYGAVRLMPVFDTVRRAGGFVVLHAPAPPPTWTGRRVMEGRWAGALSALFGTGATHGDGGLAAARRRSAAFVAASGIEPDLAEAAILAMAYTADRNRAFIRHVLAQGKVTAATQTRLRVMARQYAMRDTDGARRAGYVAQVCSSYTDWGHGRAGVPAVLADLHAPCASVPADLAGPFKRTWQTMSTPSATSRSVVVLNPADPVVPVAAQREWVAKLDANTITSLRAGHGRSTRQADDEVAVLLGR
jgi:hypothetical protein